ncbi:CRIB domain [Macleaya cordata]|uniref:CRIB domain n=1 Tax=Macleaya cordata TaxID=56857 RepID=A0A200QQ21_MACCD|nr:CRIB domain [Macleaya cordata]
MTEEVMVTKENGGGGGGGGGKGRKRAAEEHNPFPPQSPAVSFLCLSSSVIRRSLMASCRHLDQHNAVISAVHRMEIGWPTNIRHITHVTFDRFNGFLGLPVEFEVEVPNRVPSASDRVFGVSAESMQCSYDSKGNSVPTILLLMQERLYSQGGLKAEGIFRINPENSQEEHVRGQLNKGIVPDDIDVHCLAGLIKAWFRELPAGILDELSAEQVLQCNTEEKCVELIKQLVPTQAALLNWAIDLMADVVKEEEFNKMNARNIAMVFAPNMTQMSDPLTALMHAVQVMNLLKILILKTLRERECTAEVRYLHFSADEWQSDEDLCTKQEKDTGCELRSSISESSDYDDHA